MHLFTRVFLQNLLLMTVWSFETWSPWMRRWGPIPTYKRPLRRDPLLFPSPEEILRNFHPGLNPNSSVPINPGLVIFSPVKPSSPPRSSASIAHAAPVLPYR
ncbi:unnamed protein product [Darwinula stevensoni]|uniref:Uncharacterized protein n=1 Tax=Darwinula stevensoni TaxID=69355 RepID=A0A7R9AC15_9CRUS|nr:unnamed protein product [Darwinula stevensoni]CAG0899965.1 unnamed protein product [Darwinula stevensoni]